MTRKLPTLKNRHPRVSLEDYGIIPGEPADNLTRDTAHDREYKLRGNSRSMRRRFRSIAKDLRRQHTMKSGTSKGMPNDRYFEKFNSIERRRILTQLAALKKADDLEHSKLVSYIAMRKKKINLKRQKQGLTPIL